MKGLWAVLPALLAVSPVFADQYGAFQEYATQSSVKPFAKDLGGLLGSATYHQGRSLGFSGYDAGGRVGAQFSPEGGNTILRNKGVRTFMLPWIQAEVGMPFRLDGFVRGMSYQGLTIVGGGLRYGLLKISDKPWSPQLLVSGVAHAVVHTYFSASHTGGSLVFSIGTPHFTPYVGGGFDRTVLVVRSSLADPTLNGDQIVALESRFSGGLQFRPWTFIYINAAYVYMHRHPGLEGGLGIRF